MKPSVQQDRAYTSQQKRTTAAAAEAFAAGKRMAAPVKGSRVPKPESRVRTVLRASGINAMAMHANTCLSRELDLPDVQMQRGTGAGDTKTSKYPGHHCQNRTSGTSIDLEEEMVP
jgi:hypothetical protein